MIRYAVILCVTLIFTCLFILLYRKFNHQTDTITALQKKTCFSVKWLVFIVFEVAALYMLLAYVISTAWLKGDDFIFFHYPEISLVEKLKIICGRYTTCNGRLGDIMATLIGLSENRWEHVIFTPLFIMALPFAVYRLIAPSHQSIFALKGAGFILFFTVLLTVSVSLSPWRNFWCFAAAINYIWPLPIICVFLSFFRTDISPIRNRWSAIFIGGGLGLYSAWSLECVTLFLLPGLFLWLLFRFWRKKHIPMQCASGFVGAVMGAFFLVATPALSRRAAAELATRAFKPDEYNWEQMWEFVTNQTPENMELLRAGTVTYLLDGIPLPLHMFYVPVLLKHFAACCGVAMCLFVALMVVHAITSHGQRKQIFTTSVILAVLSVAVACSYLVSCIPNDMSFLPPSLIVLIACAYLYIRLSGRIGRVVQSIVLLSVIIISVSRIAPSVIEAAQYKKYEQARLESIHQQIATGERNIIVFDVYEVPPQDKLGLIRSMGLSGRAEAYPNFIASMSYGVDSVVLKSARKTE